MGHYILKVFGRAEAQTPLPIPKWRVSGVDRGVTWPLVLKRLETVANVIRSCKLAGTGIVPGHPMRASIRCSPNFDYSCIRPRRLSLIINRGPL